MFRACLKTKGSSILRIILANLLSLPLFAHTTEEIDVAKISEAMGHMIGKNLNALGVDFDLEAIVKGLKEESEGKASPMNEDECVQAITILQEEKIVETVEEELNEADAISNGDQIQDNENYPFPTTNSSKHR